MRKRFSVKSFISNITQGIKETITGKTEVNGKVFSTKLVRRRKKVVKKIQKKFVKQLLKETKKPFFSGGEEVSNVATRRLARRKEAQASGVAKTEIPKSIKTDEELLRSIERLEGRLMTDYQQWKIDIYRKNFLTSAKKVFGDYTEAFEEIVDLVNSIDDETLFNSLNSYEELDIGYIYSLESYESKLNEIINTLKTVSKKSSGDSVVKYDSDLRIM